MRGRVRFGILDEMSRDRVRTLRELAAQRRSDRSYRSAAAAYRELEELEPDEPLWPKSLAECLEHSGESGELMAAMKRAAAKYAARGFVVRAIAMHKMILRRDPTDQSALDGLVELRDLRVTGVDRYRRADAATDLDASMHGDGAEPAVAISPGVYEIPLAAAREAEPAPSRFELDALAASPLFARLSSRSLRSLADAAGLVELAAGDVLYHAGEHATAMYMLVDGQIALTAGERSLVELGAGDVVGVVGLVANAPRPTTAIARAPTHLLEIPRASVDVLLRSAPELRDALLDLARQRLLAVLLSTHSLFCRLPGYLQQWLASRFRFLEVAEGAPIVTLGQPPGHLHVVMTGRLEVLGVNGEVIAALGTGSLAAETEFLAQSPVVLPIVARRRSFVLALPHPDFLAVAHEHPQFLDDVALLASAPVWDPSIVS